MAINDKIIITPETNPKGIPPQMPGQLNFYRPSDIKRYGTEQFLAQVAPKEPIQTNFTFTPEEQQRMDALLSENEPA